INQCLCNAFNKSLHGSILCCSSYRVTGGPEGLDTLCDRCRHLIKKSGILQKLTNRIGRLGALAEPLGSSLGLQFNNSRVLGRIIRANIFDEAAISATALVGNNYLVERSFFSACTCKPDFCSHWCFLLILFFLDVILLNTGH